MKELTTKQAEVLAFIRTHHATFKICPTSREIQARFGFASQTAAMSHLNALMRKGAPISKTVTGRLVYHDPTISIPWEDVKPLIDELKKWLAHAADDPTERTIETFYAKYPHLK